MDKSNIDFDGVFLIEKQIINGDKGSVRHIITSEEEQFKGFKEAYFSTINSREIKGWKKHLKMTVNLLVCSGKVEFYICNDESINNPNKKKCLKIVICEFDNKRLTIEPNIWFAFRCISDKNSMILNISNHMHDNNEVVNMPIDLKILEKFSILK